MSKGLIITDTIDLTIKDKSKFSFDSFYKTSDSKKGSSIINKDSSTKMYGPVYAILSTSAKDINSRNYSYDSLKQNVINHDWTNYSRPLLRHHNLEDGTSCGRIDKSFFYDHATKEVTAEFSDSKLNKDVLDYFESKGAFDKGTASTIVELSVDEYTYNRMKNGLDNTVSQSSMMSKATCNICGKDYFDGCQHIAGNSYEIEDGEETVSKTCILQCSDFYPVELSIVNCPGNDSSITYVPKYSKHSENNDSNEIEPIIEDKSTMVTNKDNEDKNNKMEDLMFKELLKDALLKTTVSAFEDEKITEPFNKVFDSLETEEQVVAFKDFLDATVAKIKDANSKTEEVVEETERPTETEDSVTEEPASEETVEETVETEDNAEETKPIDDSAQMKNLEQTFTTSKTTDAKVEKHFKKVNAILANL